MRNEELLRSGLIAEPLQAEREVFSLEERDRFDSRPGREVLSFGIDSVMNKHYRALQWRCPTKRRINEASGSAIVEEKLYRAEKDPPAARPFP